MSAPKVYAAITAVMAHLAKEGISKDRKSGDGGGPKFAFRGIDDVYNALSSVLAENKLMMLPRMIGRTQTERQTRAGGAMFYTTVEAEFDLVSAEDGSMHTIRTFGEAMDSSDKSTNKAQSAAFKYAAMQAFCIPTEGDNDADATSHEVAPARTTRDKPADRKADDKPADDIAPPGGWGDWARKIIDTVADADTTQLDAIVASQKQRLNAVKKIDATMHKAIGDAFGARRAILADEVPF